MSRLDGLSPSTIDWLARRSELEALIDGYGLAPSEDLPLEVLADYLEDHDEPGVAHQLRRYVRVIRPYWRFFLDWNVRYRNWSVRRLTSNFRQFHARWHEQGYRLAFLIIWESLQARYPVTGRSPSDGSELAQMLSRLRQLEGRLLLLSCGWQHFYAEWLCEAWVWQRCYQPLLAISEPGRLSASWACPYHVLQALTVLTELDDHGEDRFKDAVSLLWDGLQLAMTRRSRASQCHLVSRQQFMFMIYSFIEILTY